MPNSSKSGQRTLSDGQALTLGYRTKLGSMYCGKIESFLGSNQAKRHLGKVQLIFTSPPFPLNRKKAYGNLQGEEFATWLANLAPALKMLLTPTGSIVMEMGNAWEPGRPVMSVLALESMLKFLKTADLKLAQQFICYNPARLPSPAQWVNVDRIRLKDAFTHIWWMSATDRPYADNRKVLKPYSKSMENLLRTGKYNSGRRPSEHNIGSTSFLTDNKGAISPSVLTMSNTSTGDPYQKYCREEGIKPHPARMPHGLPEFFIKFLTNEDDLVLDPFGGSNTTGAVAQELNRRWVSVEPNALYVMSSRSRFSKPKANSNGHNRITKSATRGSSRQRR